MNASHRPLILAVVGCQLLTAGCRTPPARPAAGAVTKAVVSAPQPPMTANPTARAREAGRDRIYAFGWGDLPAPLARTRGGTSSGAPVILAPGRALPLPEIAAATDDFARDRSAILALAGDYKVGFHFLETLGFAPDHTPRPPYHSWATEHIRVIADTGRFISLQHTLVMFFQQPDGTVSPPMLTKHWRQDWSYEPSDLHVFRGDNTWARRRLDAAGIPGTWVQSVWQVDDSPRYAAPGRWTHDGNRSLWTGETTWRPLPRREQTVRQDYAVMEGAHRIVLTPTGWLHEQFNWKRVAGNTSSIPTYVGEEWGLDRYERISAPSLAAADDYWKRTAPYWAEVRRAWAEVHAEHDRFALRRTVEGQQLFEMHFAYANTLENGGRFDSADAARHARETLRSFLSVP